MIECENDAKKINTYRSQAIVAARQLLYPHEVIDKLKKSSSIGEIQLIMVTTRKKSISDDSYY